MISTAIRQILLWTVVCGLLYPLLVTALSQAVLSPQANGSMLAGGHGSRLVGQSFTKSGYFWPRPSATSDHPYNASSSSGTNYGIREPRREEQTTQFPKDAPADLRYASGSGLDPHITPEAARYQVPRVARERNLSESQVTELVNQRTQGRTFGVLGNPRVNVVLLNADLDAGR